VAKLFLLLCYLRDGGNKLLSTRFTIFNEFNKQCVCTNETEAHNLCNDSTQQFVQRFILLNSFNDSSKTKG